MPLIISHDFYTNWLGKNSGLLVVSADTGCGKSVLAKYLVDSRFRRNQELATIFYFFFQEQLQNTQKQALCALLHQLLIHRPCLIKHALGKYEEKLLKMRRRTYLWVYIVFAYLQSHCIQQKITSVESIVDVILPTNVFQSYEKIPRKPEDIQQA